MAEKEILRSWLFKLLADLEICEDVDAQKDESPGGKVTLTIQFKI